MGIESLGLTFLPRGADDDPSGPGGNRLEDVFRVLSFRLPRILGSRPIAPSELLNGAGGAGDPLGSAIANGIIQNILKGAPGAGGAPGFDMPEDPGAPSPTDRFLGPVGPGAPRTIPAIPTPRVTPGLQPPADGGFTATPLPSPTPTTPEPDFNTTLPREDHERGGNAFDNDFAGVDRQLRRGSRRIL